MHCHHRISSTNAAGKPGDKHIWPHLLLVPSLSHPLFMRSRPQAVAGEDPNISVISVAEARVTHLLQGAWPVHRL